MKSSIRPLGIIIISVLGFLLIITLYTDKSALEYSAREMHEKVLSSNYMINEEEAGKLDNPVFIDIRNPHQYVIDHYPGALNIPVSAVLEESYEAIWLSNRPKVIISDDPVMSHEAWMLMNQIGYQNLHVLDSSKLLVANR